MPRAQRIGVSALSGVVIVVIVVLAILGVTGGGAPAQAACAARTDSVYLAAAYTVARRIANEERAGTTVMRARHTIATDRVLARAVATGDLAVVHRELLAILYNHEHIVRLRVLRGGRVLGDVGGPLVLSPVGGSLRLDGREVGTFSFSVQDDMGYRLLVARLVGARTVMRYEGVTVMADVAVGHAALPAGGVVHAGGVAYLVSSLDVGHFPSGTLHIALLVPRPPAALALQSCAQVRADVLGDVARRVYAESLHGPAITSAIAGVRHDGRLAAALARGDLVAARRELHILLGEIHLLRLRVTAGGSVVADLGTRAPLVGPVTVPVIDRSGSQVGSAVLAVQSADGFVGVSSYLTQSDVLVYAGGRQLAGRLAGPPSPPRNGPVALGDAGYQVSSFAGSLFGGGAMTVYTLARNQG